jgi:aryl-alcohol dehydrogenase-like predicted oxidoreductase
MVNDTMPTSLNGRAMSSFGIGTYLGAVDDQTDSRLERCILRCVQLGINVIDTSPNYRAERSECVIGNAISAFRTTGGDRRDLCICTKFGFLPCQRETPQDIDAHLHTRFVESGLLQREWIQGLWQCFHPKYVRWQFEESLSRLRCEYIDVYYLHNPEELLKTLSPVIVERTIRQAFESLAPLCRDNLIRYLGVSTWSGFTESTPERRLSLEQLCRWADAAGVGSSFRFLQMPFNLGDHAAITGLTQHFDGNHWSIMRLAGRFNLRVVASAPFMQGRLLKAAMPDKLKQMFPDARTNAQICLAFCRSTPGISTTLMGVTSERHLEENAAVLSRPMLEASAYIQAFR